MDELGRDRLSRLLQEIDEEASLLLGRHVPKLPVVIAGGSAFILRSVTKRPTTHDIDILHADARLREVLAGYPMINGDIAAFCDSIPYNFEDRLEPFELFTNTVEYLMPSLEDLAVMKLHAWRPNDIADLTNEAFLSAVDWERLDYLIFDPDEARASCLSDRRYQELVATYRHYERLYRGGARQ